MRQHLSHHCRCQGLLALFLGVLPLGLSWSADNLAARSVHVRVAPADLGKRAVDERPAEYVLDVADIAPQRALDPGSLQVVRVDPKTGKDLSGPLPLRWYDDAIPYHFAEFEQNAHATDGINRTFVKRPRWGDFYNLIGDGKSGKLVWTHKQEGKEASHYAIRFQLLPESKSPQRLPPRGFVGDGSHRCGEIGATSTGMIHSRVAVSDWDGDGLPDLLIGGSKGQVLLYPNRGTRQKPAFPHARLLLTGDGKPLDVGWSSSPLAVDWDGDGVTDLLSGCERNRILFFRNEGTNRAPRLVNKGFVTALGKPLALPTLPVPKSPPGVYELDYYPVLEAVDWDGDGKLDLLAGGFITGRIYFYRNTGKNADGTPKLEDKGPLEADGKPLNVGDWAAAPTAADFDGDGDLDLITGNMPLNAGGGDSADADHFLRYYENVGTRSKPRLMERPFPKTGKFPHAALGTPRAVDLNGDGLFDLVVSANANLYLYFNVGAKAAPKFAVHGDPLPGYGGGLPLPTFGLQFVPFHEPGKLDMLAGLTLFRQVGPGEYRHESLLAPGNRIEHPAPRGDGWTFTHLADLDGDAKLDLFYATHEGNIWLHRNLGGKPARFDEKGRRLETIDGKPIRVGPEDKRKMDFDVLQGARTTMAAADFDGDGLLDLVVGDTFGHVRLYQNAGTKQEARFAAARVLGKMAIRMIPVVADWDNDGRLDVVGAAASGEVEWWRNIGAGNFAAAAIKYPPVPYGPAAAVVDWNQDGDADLIVGTDYGYFCWFERSFLERGYAKAERVPK